MIAINNNNDDERNRPHLVEEMSSCEIYASILGIQRRKTNKQPAQPGIGEARRIMPSHVVVQDSDNDSDDCNNDNNNKQSHPSSVSAFASSFRMALEGKINAPPSQLKLSVKNKGFRLLQRMGWTEKDGGLGKNRQGTLLPVTTTLKNDRKGLGLSKAKPRITHNNNNNDPTSNTNITERSKRQNPNQKINAGVSKAERRRKRRLQLTQEEQRDKKVRMMLRTDISDDYEAMYSNLF